MRSDYLSTDQLTRVDAADAAAYLGEVAWLIWRCSLKSRDHEWLVRYRLDTLATRQIPRWRRRRRYNRPEGSGVVTVRTVSRAMRLLEQNGLMVKIGLTRGGCAIRRVHGVLAPGDASGILVPVEFAKNMGLDVPAPDPDRMAHPVMEPEPMRFAQGVAAHPVFGRLLTHVRADLVAPSIPSVPDSEIDYTPPLWPKLESGRPVDTIRALVAAYRAAIHYHTHQPCHAYESMTRGESSCLQAAARVMRKHDLPPHQWALHWTRVMMNMADPWVPGADPPPRITDVFNPGAVSKQALAAHKVDMALPWVRSPAGFKIAALLDNAREQLHVCMRYERITQADLDKAARIMTIEVDRLREELRQWNARRYGEDALRIQQGEWVWA